jgi:hypothetical protein
MKHRSWQTNDENQLHPTWFSSISIFQSILTLDSHSLTLSLSLSLVTRERNRVSARAQCAVCLFVVGSRDIGKKLVPVCCSDMWGHVWERLRSLGLGDCGWFPATFFFSFFSSCPDSWRESCCLSCFNPASRWKRREHGLFVVVVVVFVVVAAQSVLSSLLH